MTSQRFRSIWRKLRDEESLLTETLGRTGNEYWFDVTELSKSELPEVYALVRWGDRFIWFDDNAHIDLVALRGDPGARAIERCVMRNIVEKNIVETPWPKDAGRGAAIEACGVAVSPVCWFRLRDGTYFEEVSKRDVAHL